MAVSYKKLWKLLIDKEMSAVELREKTGIAPNTMTKLRRDEEVSMPFLHRPVAKVKSGKISLKQIWWRRLSLCPPICSTALRFL